MRAVWSRIGGRYAITLRAWLLLSPIAIFGTIGFAPEGLITDDYLFPGILVGFISHLVTGLMLLPAYFSYLSPSQERPSRPLAAFLTLLAAGAVRGLTVSFLLEEFGLVLQADYVSRIVSGSIIVAIWFAVTAVLVGARREYIEFYNALESSLQQTKDLVTQGQNRVAEVRAELVEQVKTTLREALASKKATGELHNLADSVIRPLAHALGSHEPVVFSPEPPPKRIKLGPVIKTALYEFPFNPLPVMAVGILSTIYSRVWTFGPAGFIDTAIQALAIVVIFNLAKSLRVRGAVVPLVWVLTGMLGSFGTGLVFGTLSLDHLISGAYLSVSVSIPAGFVALLLAYDAQRERNLDSLRAAIESVKWHESKLNQELWIEKKRLARYVHSEIQSRIRAAALANKAGTMADVKALQADCIEALDLARELPSFERFYRDTVELWEGVVKIKLDAQQRAIDAIAADSFGLAATVEVIREGLGNAVKHGKAKHAQLSLSLTEQPNPELIIEVRNDGKKPSSEPQRGFGLSTLDEVTLAWKLEARDNQTVLSARVPVSPIQ